MKLKYHTKPWKHQKKALKYLLTKTSGALYTMPGSGKTKIMIDLIRNSNFRKVLIVCPKKACDVWVEEIEKHAPEGEFWVRNASKIEGTDQKVAKLKKDWNYAKKFPKEVLIINYESVWRKPLRDYLLTKKGLPDCVMCDESHRIKGAGSKVSRYLALLGKRVTYKYILTGTPVHESPLDAYGQYRFLDNTIFGTNFDSFKHQYGNWVTSKSGFPILNRDNPYKNMDEFKEKFFSLAFIADAELSLPPTMDITIEFDLDKRTQKLYKKLKKDKAIELKDSHILPKNVLSIIGTLQMITCGYMRVEDDEGKTKVKRVGEERQKALKELINDLPLDESLVIFCKYKKDLKNAKKVVESFNRKTYEISGAKSEYLDFKKSQSGSVVVVQIAAGAEGIDLTKARYCIYYSLSHSNTTYEQSRYRVHRPNQKRPVTYYTLVATIPKVKTIDEQIQEALSNKVKLVEEIMKKRRV